METVNRKDVIKNLTITIRTLKNDIKDVQRNGGYVSWSDYKKLFSLREEARYLNIIHALLKKNIDFNNEFQLLESVKKVGVETHWNEGNEPDEYTFQQYCDKYNIVQDKP